MYSNNFLPSCLPGLDPGSTHLNDRHSYRLRHRCRIKSGMTERFVVFPAIPKSSAGVTKCRLYLFSLQLNHPQLLTRPQVKDMDGLFSGSQAQAQDQATTVRGHFLNHGILRDVGYHVPKGF